MDSEDIPSKVLDALRFRGISEAALADMTPKEVFLEYCEWEGLLGSWGETLWEVTRVLHKAQGEN